MNIRKPIPKGGNRLFFSLFLLAILSLAGCGGGASGGSAPPIVQAPPVDDNGIAIIGLTDAAGDFYAYDVEVISIRLERANGVSVETLPESMMVDFAQYVEATEFVTAASVPNGLYTGMSLVLDYSNARIVLEDENGDAVEAIVVDENGDPVAQTELRVDFSDSDTFRIAPGIPAHVTLDFDLSASHKIDLDITPPEATLAGVLVADTLLEHPKPHRARGLLIAVDIAAGEFDLAIRPFFRPAGDFGRLTVATDDETSFEIDGVGYDADDGLLALADKPRGTSVVAFGKLDRDSRAFIAESVLAGSSVPFGESDIASGTVVARDGNALTLRGVTLVRTDMSAIFNNTLTVQVGGDTVVTQQGASLVTIGVDDISVGQRITALGELSDDVTLDASEGLVRVRYADLNGITVQVSPLVMDLTSINRRRIALYDFTGTGAGSDADPDDYEIDSGNLTLSGIGIGAPTKVRGLVAPFGTAPQDFFAKTIADVSIVPAHLTLNWLPPGDPNAVISIDASGIVVNLDQALLGTRHHFVQAGIPQDLLDNGTMLSLLPSATGRGVFAIRQNRRQQVFFDFERFGAELADRLDGTVAIIRIGGRGDLGEGNDFTPRRLLITLE